MSQLINIFLEPGKAFEALREKPAFLAPLLLLCVVAGASVAAYFMHVDPEWFTQQQRAQMLASGTQMSAAEIDQAMKIMPGARVMGAISAVLAPLTMVVVMLLFAVYYLLAGKVAGRAASFRHGLALTVWSSMPMLLGSLVVLAGTFTSSPQTSLESLQLLNVDPLFVQLPMGHDWSTLAKSFSLLNFWCWFLAALGWKTWFRAGWGESFGVVLLPSVVIYGAMALFALF